MNVFKSISDESINLIVTDPPYPTTKRGISKSTNTGGLVRSELGRKGKIFEYNNIDVSIYAPECYRVLKDGSHFYIMTNHVNLQHILNTCTDVGFHFIKSLI
jgi:site-specific DNA-methyltransferase (adenine-specific)